VAHPENWGILDLGKPAYPSDNHLAHATACGLFYASPYSLRGFAQKVGFVAHLLLVSCSKHINVALNFEFLGKAPRANNSDPYVNMRTKANTSYHFTLASFLLHRGTTHT
jgi:hypothetical protein